MVSRTNYRWWCNLKLVNLLTSEMNQSKKRENDVNGTQPFGLCVTSGKHHMVEQYRLSQHQVTGGTGVNILNNLSDKRITPIRSDRQKGTISGKKKSLFESSEQNLCNHARAIVKNE